VFRQNQDLAFSNLEIQQLYDFQPRGFLPGPEDFKLPAEICQLLPTSLRGS